MYGELPKKDVFEDDGDDPGDPGQGGGDGGGEGSSGAGEGDSVVAYHGESGGDAGG